MCKVEGGTENENKQYNFFKMYLMPDENSDKDKQNKERFR